MYDIFMFESYDFNLYYICYIFFTLFFGPAKEGTLNTTVTQIEIIGFKHQMSYFLLFFYIFLCHFNTKCNHASNIPQIRNFSHFFCVFQSFVNTVNVAQNSKTLTEWGKSLKQQTNKNTKQKQKQKQKAKKNKRIHGTNQIFMFHIIAKCLIKIKITSNNVMDIWTQTSTISFFHGHITHKFNHCYFHFI